MPTHIALTPGLERLAEKLRHHGFVIVDPEDNVQTPAALVYSRASQGIDHVPHTIQPGGSNTGLTMLIDADTTSEDEIIQILSHNRL